jgi:hypothetical protein
MSSEYPPFDKAALDTLSDYYARPRPACPWGCVAPGPTRGVRAGVPPHAWELTPFTCPVCGREFTAYSRWARDGRGGWTLLLEYRPGPPASYQRQRNQPMARTRANKQAEPVSDLRVCVVVTEGGWVSGGAFRIATTAPTAPPAHADGA